MSGSQSDGNQYYGDEKIGAAGKTLATENLVLDDDKDFVAYEPFAAKAASYSRTVEGTTWATLCLPFEVSLANQNFRAFKLLSADDVAETVELEEIETNIAAGTPVIIKMKEQIRSASLKPTRRLLKMFRLLKQLMATISFRVSIPRRCSARILITTAIS